jgi:hypothetical protein
MKVTKINKTLESFSIYHFQIPGETTQWDVFFFCGFKIDHLFAQESREKEIIIKRYVVMQKEKE